jgi:catechol 2,3-dioxygenase-like lactoylglutathione lyase family enzyme
MQSKYEKAGQKLPRLQHVSLSIPAGSQEQIRAFYGGLLGLKEKQVPEILAGRGLVWFAVGDGEMELHFVTDTLLQRPEEARHFCLEVNDVDTYRAKLTQAGYTIRETDPIPNRPRFFTMDPAGNSLELTTIQDDYS